MKKNNSIGSFVFGLMVFLAILIQSAHSFHHLEEAFTREHCHHDYSKNHSQITHNHSFDHCFTCEFTFSNSLKSEISSFNFKKSHFHTVYNFFQSREITQFFCGSLFALRAPPIFIV